MINKELVNYIKKQQEGGRVEESIKGDLKKGAGWTDFDIDEAFNFIYKKKKFPNHKIYILIGAVAVLALGFYFFMGGSPSEKQIGESANHGQSTVIETKDFTFTLPKNYDELPFGVNASDNGCVISTEDNLSSHFMCMRKLDGEGAILDFSLFKETVNAPSSKSLNPEEDWLKGLESSLVDSLIKNSSKKEDISTEQGKFLGFPSLTIIVDYPKVTSKTIYFIRKDKVYCLNFIGISKIFNTFWPEIEESAKTIVFKD